MDRQKIEEAWKVILSEGLQLDMEDPNFIGTPDRMGRAYEEIFKGLNCKDEIQSILDVSFPSDYTGIVAVKSIHCYSSCPHHFLPVEYYILFGYIPDGKVLGISKLSRFIALLASQPLLQEDFTKNIVDSFMMHVSPKGCGVYVKGRHMCMAMRGVRQDNCWTYTSDLRGIFFDDCNIKSEFLGMTKE